MSDSYVCSGAVLRCTCGTNQAKLTVLPTRTVFLTGQPMANISDHLSFVNLGAFGRCRSFGFPATASATAAAHGKLTPMPCMHNTPFPWMGGKNDYIIKGDPALLKSSTCQCLWGGTISIVGDGQADTGRVDNNREEKETEEEMKARTEEKQQLDVDSVLDGIQLALDIAGLAPGVGAIPDLLNASISALRGNWTEAGMSLLAAVPGIGDAAAAAKMAQKGVKAAKTTAKKAGTAVKDVNKVAKPQTIGEVSVQGRKAIVQKDPFLSITAKKDASTASPKFGSLTMQGRASAPKVEEISSATSIKMPESASNIADKANDVSPDSLKEVFKYKGKQPKPQDAAENIDLSF